MNERPKAYIFMQDFKSPYVIATGIPHKPTKIQMKKFVKGEVVKGILKKVNDQPAFVLVAGTIVVPLSVIKEVVTKAIIDPVNSSAEGDVKPKSLPITTTGTTVVVKKSSIKYLDAIIIGAIIGLGSVYLAEKKAWIVATPDKKNFLYGGIAGAVLAAYLVYRNKNA